eukprot:s755_g25.t7
MLLEAQHLQLDPLVEENYSFRELVQRCVARRAFENSGSGHLTAQDLSVMAQTFWPELSQDELRDLFQNVCRNRSGYIQMHEFCAALGFDERSAVSAAEVLRSISQLDGALQVLLDRIRISVLEAIVLYNAVNAKLGRSCRLFHGHRELKPYHHLNSINAELGLRIQVIWTGTSNAQSVRHERAFAALKSDIDGTVVTWGDREWGGDSSKVQQRLKNGATQVFGTFGAFEVANEEDIDCGRGAFAATKANGSVVTWGDQDFGGDSSSIASQLRSGVTQVSSTYAAFAATKADGSVVVWGHPDYGGNDSKVRSRLMEGVVALSTTQAAFSALKADGSVVTWGDGNYGGDAQEALPSLQSGVKLLAATYGAFSAVKEDGSVVSWGHKEMGGRQLGCGSRLQQGVCHVCGTYGAFAATREDGSVVVWGDAKCGGDAFDVDLQSISQICATYSAFAALSTAGSVIAWGDPDWGGDASSVANDLRQGVVQVCSTYGAFAALKEDGSVVTWGDPSCGGDSSTVASRIRKRVFQLCSTYGAFAATKADGTVVTWGDADWGGDSTAVQDQLYMAFDSSDEGYDGLLVGVVAVSGTGGAFAARKVDGSVVTWGDPASGGKSSKVSHTAGAFAAVKADGSVVAWGDPA